MEWDFLFDGQDLRWLYDVQKSLDVDVDDLGLRFVWDYHFPHMLVWCWAGLTQHDFMLLARRIFVFDPSKAFSGQKEDTNCMSLVSYILVPFSFVGYA